MEFVKRFFVLIVLLAMLAPPAAAEVFLLAGGGRIQGDLVNRDEVPRRKYIIRTDDGAVISLDAARVQKVLHQRLDEVEYERIRPTYADTAAAQWELAQWCREHKLSAKRVLHLRRVIELDPEHVEARRAFRLPTASRRPVGHARRVDDQGRLRQVQGAMENTPRNRKTRK